MSEETRQNIAFKVMPLSDNANPPLFYSDVIGVNTTTVGRGTRDLAVQLANVMAATDTVVASIGSGGGSSYPQYLMAARASVFTTLGQSFPIHNDMYALVRDSDPVLFKLNSTARPWVEQVGPVIRSQSRQNYACGCDMNATSYIADDVAAQSICPASCSANGGWNGQWTNQPPATGGASSVCGCNACSAAALTALVGENQRTPRPNH
jgi:thiamine pyridinylase